MNKFEKILSRLLTIFTFIAIGNLIGTLIDGEELPSYVVFGYAIFIPLGLIATYLDWKKEKAIKK